MKMQRIDTARVAAAPAILTTEVTNKVVRNTYLLLTLTLITSAVAAGFAMVTGAQPVHWLLMLAVFIGMPFVISAVRNTVWALPLTFLFTGFMGYVLGPILTLYLGLPNGGQIVLAAFGTTALMFLGLSAYAITTRRDFSFMGGFLMVGMIVVLIAIVANIFMEIPALSLTISAAAVILMSGMILFDTSRMINGGETNYVMMTVSLFADIYVMFVHLLNLFAFLSGEN
jgi:modulator of FtsH protease